MPPEPFFAGLGIDRADLLRGDPSRLAELASRKDARQLAWRDGWPAVDVTGQLEWKTPDDPALFLGIDGSAPCFSALETPGADIHSAFATLGLLSAGHAPLFAAALSLANWHARHRYCANCGCPADLVRGGWSRRCGDCECEQFPRVDPVVIMLAEHEDRLLLGRQPHYPPGRYSALAGFVEVGESIEAAVARELGEEAGITVGEVRYLSSQPWPFPSSLMIGCWTRAETDSLTVDTTELEHARWFTRAEVEAAVRGDSDAPFQPPPPAAIARALLEHWLAA